MHGYSFLPFKYVINHTYIIFKSTAAKISKFSTYSVYTHKKGHLKINTRHEVYVHTFLACILDGKILLILYMHILPCLLSAHTREN